MYKRQDHAQISWNSTCHTGNLHEALYVVLGQFSVSVSALDAWVFPPVLYRHAAPLAKHANGSCVYILLDLVSQEENASREITVVVITDLEQLQLQIGPLFHRMFNRRWTDRSPTSRAVVTARSLAQLGVALPNSRGFARPGRLSHHLHAGSNRHGWYRAYKTRKTTPRMHQQPAKRRKIDDWL